MRLDRKEYKIAIFLVALVFLLTAGTAAGFYFKKDILAFVKNAAFYNINKNKAPTPQKVETTSADENDTAKVVAENSAPSTPPPSASAIKKEPPKHSGTSQISGTTTSNSDGTKTTIVSDGGTTPIEMPKIADLGPSSSIRIVDETGDYQTLGDTLRSYINSTLLKGAELPYLYQITIKNAGDTNYEGQYYGSYTMDGNGKITSAFGYIVLNVYYHKDSPQFVDYMKLTLAHEYGHHYTLYHKWVDLNLGASVRFPDSYYSVRPLSKTTTAVDYSKGWENCEAEIIAEDYSYLYSGYGYHAMSGTYGYPSAATKTWLQNISQALASAPAPTAPEPTPTPPPEPESPEPETPSEPLDSQNPVAVIFNPTANPSEWLSGNLILEANASDNVAVTKMEFYVGSQLLASQNGSYIGIEVQYFQGHVGDYIFTVKAYDAAGNIGIATVTVTKK